MSDSKALSLNQQPETEWTVISGPLSGTRMKMTSVQFSIGRSHECELALQNDPKVSRKHARVYWDGSKFRIQSLVSQNPVLIDGKPISDSEINAGTIIQLGQSQLRFDQMGSGLAAVPMNAPHLAPVPGFGGGFPPAMQMPSRPPSSSSKRKKQTQSSPFTLKRIIIYGAIGLVLWMILSPGGSKKKNLFEFRTEKQIQADIQTAQDLQKAAEKMRADRLNPTVAERNAQEHYVKGFRDFEKGQYERSISSFQACLALNPDHPLCNRYLKLSQKKFGELVQYHMVLGRQYRDQNQFRACRSSFRNVMVMIKDPSSPIYKEAKTNYMACNSMVENRF